MNNPLNAGQNSNMPNINALFQRFMQNPVQALRQSGFKIPNDICNNPQQIVQHFMNSGQISQQQLNSAYQARPQFEKMIKR